MKRLPRKPPGGNTLPSAELRLGEGKRSCAFSVPVELNSQSGGNSRQSHFIRAARVKKQREALSLAILAAGFRHVFERGHLRLPLHVRCTRVAPNALDSDNLTIAFKALRDELCKHLGVDDKTGLIRWSYAQRKGAVREYGATLVIHEEECFRCHKPLGGERALPTDKGPRCLIPCEERPA